MSNPSQHLGITISTWIHLINAATPPAVSNGYGKCRGADLFPDPDPRASLKKVEREHKRVIVTIHARRRGEQRRVMQWRHCERF